MSRQPVRVMVVDDSAVIRGLLSRALEGDPELRVVASVGVEPVGVDDGCGLGDVGDLLFQFPHTSHQSGNVVVCVVHELSTPHRD